MKAINLLLVALLFVACGGDGDGDGSDGDAPCGECDGPADVDGDTDSNPPSTWDTDSDVTGTDLDSGTSTGDTETGGTDTSPPPLDTDIGPFAYVVNLVVPGSYNTLNAYVGSGAGNDDLRPITNAFYETYGDTFDFLYLFAAVPDGTARYSVVNREAMPGAGLPNAATDGSFGSAGRLKGVVGVRITDSGNGPTLHETAHHWGMYLDSGFGFGVDAGTNYGYHWGTAGVYGQLGGFDPGSLKCMNPAGAAPPCTPESNGGFLFEVGEFGPGSNGGDGIPYADMELYLMGLLPASAITASIPVLEDGVFLQWNEAAGTFDFEAAGLHYVTIDDIVAQHGPRAQLASSDRVFTAAFVVVTEAPATQGQMDKVETWAKIFGNVEDSPFLYSFEDATGGRAMMDVRIPLP